MCSPIRILVELTYPHDVHCRDRTGVVPISHGREPVGPLLTQDRAFNPTSAMPRLSWWRGPFLSDTLSLLSSAEGDMLKRWLYSYYVVLASLGVLSVVCVVAAVFLDRGGTIAYLGLLELGIAFATILLTLLLIERVLDHRRVRERGTLEGGSGTLDLHALGQYWARGGAGVCRLPDPDGAGVYGAPSRD